NISKVRQGESYCVRSGQIHASEVVYGRAAATLVLLSENVAGTSVVVGSRDGESKYTFDRSDVDPNQYVQAKQIALEARAKLLCSNL
ncbi:MAG: hypothetical protein AAFY98_12410, partial [Verrucomicrobiota bacterium]